jgi:hypothetical protein
LTLSRASSPYTLDADKEGVTKVEVSKEPEYVPKNL